MISSDLKTETKICHQLLEANIIRRIRAIRQQVQYVDLLKQFYFSIESIERAIDRTNMATWLPDYGQRRKSAALINDITQSGAAIPVIDERKFPFQVNSQAEAVAVLYILEGSTLGGKYIQQMIRKQLDFPEQQMFSFFSAYGDQTQSMWSAFQDTINHLTISTEDAAIIITKANDTFMKMVDLFNEPETELAL